MSAQIDPPNRRILVIDDNEAIIQDFRKIFASAANDNDALAAAEASLFGEAEPQAGRSPFEVDSATQGRDGLALVERAQQAERPYAVAFVDMRMPPGWDGVETIAHVWEKDPHLQVVVCTAYSDYSLEELTERLAPGDRLLILKKPFDNVEAYQLATALTAKWEMTRQAQMKMNALEDAVEARTQALKRTNEALQAEIANRECLQRKLETLSVTDALTGLSNRRRFDEALAAELRRALRTQTPVGVAMIDVDHFKRYNDHYGHVRGDECLRLVAAALSASVRQGTDLVARYGGEEFVAILPGTDHATTAEIAERARAAVAGLEQPHAGGAGGVVTVSIGITTVVPDAGMSAERLLELADAALYAAKQGGRNTVAANRPG